jgi:TonB family protein
VPEKKVSKPAGSTSPEEARKEIKPSGGDEAARLERRRKIEELEMEARRLYESFTDEEGADRVYSEETSAVGPPVTNATAGGSDITANIRFKAYYDRIWAKIRSSWVPQGVTSEASLLTVVGIRIAPNGEIEQSWIEKKSGNHYYDQSALRAIRKANPLSPLPDEQSDAPLEVGINFRYPE